MEDDSDDKDDTKRRTRNLSEKKRRDTFNMLVNELCSMVSTNNRKMDKSTVLKSTISFLKNHNEITAKSRVHDVQEDWKPGFLSNEEFTYLMLEALEGFIMVFSATGQICYVSESITSLLGHNPVDMINKSIYDLTFKEDQHNLYSLLQNPPRILDPTKPIRKDNDFNFKCHLRRSTLDFRDEITYELIQFNGHFRKNTEHMNAQEASGYQNPESRLLFVCTGKLYTPLLIRDVSLVDLNRNEFTSRHSLEWKYLFLDHRAPPIIGYLPFEVLGTSGYDYYHFDDLEKLVSCHEALMQKGELTSCFYRFLTKGQQWIWLQTRFYISYHQWNSKPEFVVCSHRVVSYADVVKSTKRENRETQAATQAVAEAVAEAAAVEAAVEAAAEAAAAEAAAAEAAAAEAAAVEATAEADMNDVEMNTAPEDAMRTLSPTYLSEAGDTYASSYQPLSQPPSVKSASAGSTSGTVITAGTTATTSASWPCASQLRYATGSDTASVSGESRSSHRNSSRETHMGSETALVPQHGIGAQYLEPAPYVGTVSVPGVLPVPLQSVPVIVSPDQAQMQEQLQRKHEELQEMIIRQQEELRQVKEQLVLARLGILQPLINVPNTYVTAEEMQQNQRVPTQIIYDGGQTRAIPGYPQQQQPQPPPSAGHHPHMQQ